jgi:transposase
MELHLTAVPAKVAPGRHAALLLDQAGRHMSDRRAVPSTAANASRFGDITIVPLPAKCPELNPQENVWEVMRGSWLSNRVPTCHNNIVDHCADAWNRLEAQPWAS